MKHPLSRLRRFPPLLREGDHAGGRRGSGHGVLRGACGVTTGVCPTRCSAPMGA